MGEQLEWPGDEEPRTYMYRIHYVFILQALCNLIIYFNTYICLQVWPESGRRPQVLSKR